MRLLLGDGRVVDSISHYSVVREGAGCPCVIQQVYLFVWGESQQLSILMILSSLCLHIPAHLSAAYDIWSLPLIIRIYQTQNQ